MKSTISYILMVSLLWLGSYRPAKATTDAGLTFLEAPGAWAAAVGEARTASQDHISALSYNPASLASLRRGQASLSYNRGIAGDAFGQFMVGFPRSKAGFGMSLGTYNSGEVELFDGSSQKTVTAQSDLILTFGYAKQLKKAAAGVSGKYLSTELAESETARAFAFDVGFSAPLQKHIHIGVAIRNMGSKLKFDSGKYNIPRIASVGLSYLALPGKVPTTVLLEAPYFINDKEIRPAIGLEAQVELLVLRAGYKSKQELEGFSAGAGFSLGQFSLDYTFGLVEELDSRHRVSLSMRFGPTQKETSLVKKKGLKKGRIKWSGSNPKETGTPSFKNTPGKKRFDRVRKKPRRIYVVKPGDTLGKIAKRIYGNKMMWKTIYQANKHLLDDPQSIKEGQKILLP